MGTPFSMQGYATPNGSLPPSGFGGGNPYIAPTVIPGQASLTPGMPNTPGYAQTYNPGTMSMLPAFEKKQASINNDGFNQFKSEALRKGPSAWATLANQQLQNTTNTARDQARETSAGLTAGVNSQLASSGGLSSGARERAAEGGAKSTMAADQGLQRQNTQNQYQIASNDEQNRMQQLSQLPGMEQNQLNSWQDVAKSDLGNLISENQSQNNYNKDIYGIQSNSAAANNTANAMRDAADAQANAPSIGNGFGIFTGKSGKAGTASAFDKAADASLIGLPVGLAGQATGWW